MTVLATVAALAACVFATWAGMHVLQRPAQTTHIHFERPSSPRSTARPEPQRVTVVDARQWHTTDARQVVAGPPMMPAPSTHELTR